MPKPVAKVRQQSKPQALCRALTSAWPHACKGVGLFLFLRKMSRWCCLQIGENTGNPGYVQVLSAFNAIEYIATGNFSLFFGSVENTVTLAASPASH
ncbi:hypothetical protein [Polaromonas sp.]|uniref:hypothetical protein n=1 Tax=Polaromonas sp. TaxID=1869339 RepID=UPI0017BB0BE9|nr:hypothetical protein [Polaromonas sp.]NML85230.1 hypothetical protein [Polaromonas sp.]